MIPTIADVLALPELQLGAPQVVAGAGGLARAVRWVHVSELPDIAKLLQGGELVLTTGIAWPTTARQITKLIRDLDRARVAGVVVELGRRFTTVPDEVIDAAEPLDLPVVALRREVQFVAITEVVQRLIVRGQYELLEFANEAHRAFTTLSIEGASVQDVLDRVWSMTGSPVVLEDLAHRAVAYAASPGTAARLLRDWESRSRASGAGEGSMAAAAERWTTVPVGPRHQRWGRLVLPETTGEAEQLSMVLDRAAEALALIRLMERDRAGLEQLAHGGLLSDIMRGAGGDESGLIARALALGVPVRDHPLSGICVVSRPPSPIDPVQQESRDRLLAEAAAAAWRAAGLPALVSPTTAGTVLALAARPRQRQRTNALEDATTALAEQLQARNWADDFVVGVGREVTDFADAATSLGEAQHVADVLTHSGGTATRPYAELADLGLHGVLSTVRDDPRWVGFAEAQLGPLLAHDARRGTDLERTLRRLIEVGGNKSCLARTSHLSRPSVYARLATIEQLLGVDLADPVALSALHVALLLRSLRQGIRRPGSDGSAALVS